MLCFCIAGLVESLSLASQYGDATPLAFRVTELVEVQTVFPSYTLPLQIAPTFSPTAVSTPAFTQALDSTPPPRQVPSASLTSLPTGTPCPIPDSPKYVVVDFASVASGETAALNNASGFTDISIGLAARGGSSVMAFSYNMRGDSPNDYGGLNFCFRNPQNWKGFNGLTLWVENDKIAKEVVVQFGEGQCPTGNFVFFGDEVWKQNASVGVSKAGLIEFPFSNFRWAEEFSPKGNGRMDLNSLRYIGLYIHAPRGAKGTVYFGKLYLLP